VPASSADYGRDSALVRSGFPSGPCRPHAGRIAWRANHLQSRL